MKRIIIISDWADDTLYRYEVTTVLQNIFYPENLDFLYIASTPSSIQMSYLLHQAILLEEKSSSIPSDIYIIHDSDTRIFAQRKLRNAQGSPSLMMRLTCGITVIGSSSLYNFSLITDKIDTIYSYTARIENGHFRARDLYPILLHKYVMQQSLDNFEQVNKNIIPTLDGFYIGHIDNYGNIKTTLTDNDMKKKYRYGDLITLSIADIEQKVQYVDNMFGGEVGELIIFPSSTGEEQNPYMEITRWRHFIEEETDHTTGKEAFNDPQPGDKINIDL